MSKQTIIFAAIAGLVLTLAPAAQADLPAAPVAGPYHWAFITSGHTQAMNTTIEYYDGFVQGLADTAGIGNTVGVDWVVIGAIDGMDAKDHAPISGPVFLLDGTKVADDATDMWDGSLDHAIDRDENGNLKQNSWVFTGTAADGTEASTQAFADLPGKDWTGDCHNGAVLGDGRRTVVGDSFKSDIEWAQKYCQYWDESNPVYALSEVIPEPATMALLGLGGLGMVIRRRRRS